MRMKKLVCLFLTLVLIMSSSVAVFAEPFYNMDGVAELPYSVNLDEFSDLSPGGSYSINLNVIPESVADGAVKIDIKDGDVTTHSKYGFIYLRKISSNYRFFINGENMAVIDAAVINSMQTEGISITIEWDTADGQINVSASNSAGSVGPFVSENNHVTDSFGTLQVSSCADAEITALTIERNMRSCRVEAEPAVGGTVEGTGEYAEGSEVILTAMPEVGYIFGGWYLGEEFLGSDETLTFTVDENKTFRVVFIKQHTVTACADPEEGGNVTGAGKVADGEEVTLKIKLNDGYSFFGWYVDDVKVSSDTEYTFVPEGDVTYVAKLKAGVIENFEIKAVSSDSVGGYAEGSGSCVEGESITIKATPFSGYTFEGWYSDDELVTEESEYTFIPEESKTYVAYFVPVPVGDWIEDFSDMTAVEWTNDNNAGAPWKHWNVTNLVEVDENKKLLINKSGTLTLNLAALGMEAGNKYILEFDVAPTELLEKTNWALFQCYFEGGDIGTVAPTRVYSDGGYSYHLAALNTWKGAIKEDEMTLAMSDMWHVKVEWDTATGQISTEQGTNGGSVFTQSTTAERLVKGSKLGEFKFGAYSVPLYVDNVKITSYFSVNAEAGKYGTVYGSDKVRAGEEVTLSAMPENGCMFDGWYLDGYKVSDESDWTFNAYSSATYVAKFINPNPEYTVKTAVSPLEGGAVTGDGVYPANSKITFTAKANPGYVFDGWYDVVEGEAVSVENPWMFSATEAVDDMTYTAKFSDAGYVSLIQTLGIYVLQDKEEQFKNAITKENIERMGFDFGYEDEIDFEYVANLMWNELKSEDAVVLGKKLQDDFGLYKTCVAVALINSGDIVDVTELLDDFISKNKVFEKYFNTHVVTKNAKEYFTDFMQNKNITDFDMLTERMTESLILTSIKYPDGSGSIKKIFREYKSLLDLDSVSSYDSVWDGLIEVGEFSDIDKLMKKYDALHSAASKKDSGKNTGGGGGGGSSSGSGGKAITSGGGGMVPATVKAESQAIKETIKMKFEDLNSVPWAYESISRMYDEKIINGVSDKEFRPDYSVTREEFVKMTVIASGIEVSTEISDFTDVVKGAWYESYIATAVKNGMVNGIGEDRFGVGQQIKRQDMAVLIYNAMKKSGKFTPVNAQLDFSDTDSIAEYAKTAVSELSEIGIITGVGEGVFDPNGVATRAQAAVIIDRALEYLR